MSEQPTVVSATELDNPLIGDTIQVAIVAKDIDEGLSHLVDLGIGPFMVFEVGPHNSVDLTYDGKPADYSMILAFATHGNMMWEVIQPLEGTTIYSDFLDGGHQGLHHVAISGTGVSYEERAAELERRGYRYLMGGRAFGGDVPFGYFGSPDPTAPIVEIFDFPEGFAPTPDRWFPAPPPEEA
jgi:methylmalonyl-CoA/ethylmalonyl-CoA epimerase